jgi:hypothetical protein
LNRLQALAERLALPDDNFPFHDVPPSSNTAALPKSMIPTRERNFAVYGPPSTICRSTHPWCVSIDIAVRPARRRRNAGYSRRGAMAAGFLPSR